MTSVLDLALIPFSDLLSSGSLPQSDFDVRSLLIAGTTVAQVPDGT